MEGSDRIDERTFRINFSGDGVAKLRETVKDKLKEFMGDYTDDILVEYVIVLVRNGRPKGEARNELNVFLEDDSESFVSWLWDHLSSNLHLYVQAEETCHDEVTKTKPILVEQTERNDPKNLDYESEREKLTKEPRSRRNREWKGLVRDVAEPPPLRSSEIDNFHPEAKTHQGSGHNKRSPSPQPSHQRKRNRQDDLKPIKRELSSHPTIDAPRRLLQFAVRDAVGSLRPSNSRTEPASKRLLSVVSTSTGDLSLDDRSQRIRSVARVPNTMTSAIKATTEAAEDVIRSKCSGNVFNCLEQSTNVSGATTQASGYRIPTMENREYGDLEQDGGVTGSDYMQGHDYGELAGKMAMLDKGACLTPDSVSDNDGYDDINVVDHRVIDASQAGTSVGDKDGDSLMVQYRVAKNTDEATRKTWMKDQVPPLVANTSRKIVNISVNVNTWKPPHYKTSGEVRDMENRKTLQDSGVGEVKGLRFMKENSNVAAGIENESPMQTHQESQKTVPPSTCSYSTSRPSDDADSRTVFVSNVHFAATKDTLSRHFNKCGEVLKVTIVTDAATGQPIGSAYVEFMRKEAAELALSLNGTSFMSRILKVVMRASAHQETAPMIRPRMARALPFAARLARVPFPRGIPGAFRARLPLKTGARSLQWKRDAPMTTATEGAVNVQNGATPSSNVPSLTKRNLTYVRTEPKPGGSSGPS
ncbi:PREDICTED: protein gar2-like [Nelumbo nucifera]|uniref:Protein gar2-like n=1 Tax=Nelumbo nucifera TaxID=4432 RepID=A0A1U7ZSK5_NELNU|nr:PREDICTED: protein gar2-like [Nelumbo nucifera]